MARNGPNRNNKGRNGNSNGNNDNNYNNNNRNNNNGNSNDNGNGHNCNNNNNHSNGYFNGNGNGNNDKSNQHNYNKRPQYQDFGTGPSLFGVNPPCQYCRKTNHLSLNCYFALRGKNSQNTNQNQNGNGNGNGSGNGNGNGYGKQGKNPNKPCKHCNLTLHWSSDCPNLPQNQGYNNHHNQNQNQNQPSNRPCKYCQGPHLNKDCPTRNGNNQHGHQNRTQNPPPPQDYICRFCNHQAGHWDQDCPDYLAASPIIPPQTYTVHFSRPCRHCNGMHADGDCASHSHPQGQGQGQGQPRSHAYAEESSPSPVHLYGGQDSTLIHISYDFAVDDSGDAIMTEAPPLRGPPVYIGNGLWEQDGHIWRQDRPPGCNW